MGEVEVSRRERKQRTRRAILDAALALSEETGLAALSLRQVAREVGVVPTAFYRHFDSVEELGLALVTESFESLRRMLREVRREIRPDQDLIDDSLRVLVEHVRAQRAHFGFIARERVAGPAAVRAAIATEIERLEEELAADIGRLPGTERWSDADRHDLADLVVSAVVTTAERLLADPGQESATVARTRRQLRMLLVGARNWRPSTG